MSAPQHRMPVTFERDQDAVVSPSSADDERLCDRFTGAYSRGVARCKSMHQSCDPRLRIALLFVAAVALTALCIAIPWLPYSPWNKPLRRYSIAEEPAPMNTTLVVPRIIHNTWKTKDLPPEWKYAREQCMKMHPGYEFMLWTDESARAMIAKDYPEYLAMYDGYGYGIQRADAMRLFFLHKHGGIYIDLDIECRRSLDFLRHYPWVMPKTKPVGFSNDFMVATPGHPFLGQMLAALPGWNRRFGTKYPTVMFSTGPMFVSYQSWTQAAHYRDTRELFVLPECLYGKYMACEESLFTHYVGSTWHADDAALMKNVFRNRTQLASAALVAVLAVAAVCYRGSGKQTPAQAAVQAKGL